ncbi:MAG: hypothetical protein LKF44_08345 [Atopobiaceae bacterium]|jgi:hypothetical protein|nr:hypothetical protein [Atopobiaceae bacterium]
MRTVEDRRKSNERIFGCARDMPTLRHKTGDEFDITRSEVARWLCSQPSVMQRVFDMAAHASGTDGLPFIEFDPETRTWSGINND